MSMSTKHTTAALLAAGTGIALLALGAVTEAPSAAAFASNSAEATARGARADPGPAPVPSAGCGVEQTPGNDERSITSGGVERTYRINIPRDYEDSTPQPLVLGFHGNGSDGAEFQNYTGLPQLPAVTIFPDGARQDGGKRSWQGAPYASGADDVAFVSDLLDSIESEHCIDLNRVFATGKSNGGGMVSVLACHLGERFSAFAPVAGAYYPQSTAGCDYSTPTPMLAIHGTADATMHYDGGHRQGEDYPGVREWLRPWAETAGCRKTSEREIGRRGEEVTRTRWSQCAAEGSDEAEESDRTEATGRTVRVELYSVTDGGHVWPGELVYSGGGYATKDFSATDTIWKFFRDHPGPTLGSDR